MSNRGSHGHQRKHRTCRGKVRYRNPGDAQSAVRRIAVRSDRERVPNRAYFCGFCNGWHLTSHNRRT